jgi:hypothetical protein
VARAQRKSALNFKVLGRRLAPVRNFLIFDHLPLIKSAEAGSFDRGDMDKHIFAAARRLNEPLSLCRIEPLHGAFAIIRSELNQRLHRYVSMSKRKRGSVTPNWRSQRTFTPSKQGTLGQGCCEANNFRINTRSVLTEYPRPSELRP